MIQPRPGPGRRTVKPMVSVRTNIPLEVVIDSGDGGNENRSDYRAVPKTDRGNADYRDRGMLGFYQTNDGEPWAPPSDVEWYAGFGATEEDLKRGWKEPVITAGPEYQLESYKERSSRPRESDMNSGNVDALRQDFEFRNRNRESRGFLTRPRIPRERG